MYESKLLNTQINTVSKVLSNLHNIIDDYPLGSNNYEGNSHVFVTLCKPAQPTRSSEGLSLLRGETHRRFTFAFDYKDRLRRVTVTQTVDGLSTGTIEDHIISLSPSQRFVDKLLLRPFRFKKRLQ